MSDNTAPAARVRLKSLDYHRIASMIFNTPLLIRQTELNTTLAYLSGRMGFTMGADIQIPISMLAENDNISQFDYRTSENGYKLYGKTAVIDVMGKLVHRGGWLDAMSGLCSYMSLERMTQKAIADAAVEDIIYVHDTPGGVVSGAFDAADYIYEQSKVKPMRAIVSELSCSGGFLLASATGNIIMSRTSEVGSVGVATAHIEVSEQLKAEGKVITLIYAGDHKVDGNPYNALPEEVKNMMQESVNRVYGLFTSTVARNLDISEEAVKDTQARVFGYEEAIQVGFAHRVGTLATELQAQRKDGRTRPKKSTEVSKMNEDEKNQAISEGRVAGRSEGAKAEQERIKGIMTHASAKGRETLASHLAYSTSMSVEDAVKTLEASPAATVEAPKSEGAKDEPKSSLDKHMKKSGVTDPGDGEEDETQKAAKTAKDRKELLVAGIASHMQYGTQKEKN